MSAGVLFNIYDKAWRHAWQMGKEKEGNALLVVGSSDMLEEVQSICFG